jgi:beta-lactamase superfamily II metal-dependent hydrolase
MGGRPVTVSARLEVHVMNVGQGDAVLVVNRDLDKVAAAINTAGKALPGEPIDYVPFAMANGVKLAGTVIKALLVDGGDDEYGGDVVLYLEAHGVLVPGTVACPHLSLAVSHYHDDHMAGLRSIFKTRIDPVKKGDKVTYVERYRPAAVYRASTDKKTDPKSQRYAMFTGDLQDAMLPPTVPTNVILVGPGGVPPGSATGLPLVIDLGTGAAGIPIRAHAIASAQSVYHHGKGVLPIKSTGKTVDQNDRSLVLVLEYGSFRCLLGGDIAGNGGPAGGNEDDNAADIGTKKFFSTHADVESTLGPALKAYFPKNASRDAGKPKWPADGYCTVLKANHHGSSSSVDVNLLAAVQPRIVVISSGVKARFHRHPTPQVLRRLSDETQNWYVSGNNGATVGNDIQVIYITEMAEKVKNKPFDAETHDAKIVGDIIVRPIDESVLAVQAVADNTPVDLEIQVYGTGVQTTLADPTSKLRATDPVDPDVLATYPIGAAVITIQH